VSFNYIPEPCIYIYWALALVVDFLNGIVIVTIAKGSAAER